MGAATIADFKNALPVKEIMGHMVDYNAFGVWNRQGWLIDADGVHEQFPTTEAEWLQAESAAHEPSSNRNPHCCSCAASTARIAEPNRLSVRYERDD